MASNKLDQYRKLSEQDYGPFLEVFTLSQGDDGKFLLTVSAGYGQEGTNEKDLYELDAKPAKPLAELLPEAYDGYANPGVDMSEEYSEALGVTTKLVS